MSLNPKQAAFVREYQVDLNATQAAIRAGYTKRTAYAQGHRLLKHAEVQAHLAAAQVKRADKLELRADDVLRELMRIGFADLGEVVDEQNRLKPLHELAPEVRRAIASVKVMQVGTKDAPATVTEVKLWDKPASLTALGKHLKLFVDRLEVDAKMSLADLLTQARAKGGK